MTQTRDDGGTAFPRDNVSYGTEGMSLRDWFAGQALANPNICNGNAPEVLMCEWFGDRMNVRRTEIVAMQALTYADAMVAAVNDGGGA